MDGLSNYTITAITRPDEVRHRPDTLEPGDPGYQRMVSEFFCQSFSERDADEDSLLPYRLLCCWRICRELARHMGYMAGEASLANALSPTKHCEDPWKIPSQSPLGGFTKMHLNTELLSIIEKARLTPRKYHVSTLHTRLKLIPDQCQKHEGRIWYPGIPILPPPRPHGLSEDDPMGDMILNHWIEAVETIIRILNLHDGSEEDEAIGRLGTKYLTDPDQVRSKFPSRQSIINFEYLMVEECLRSLLRDGIAGTRRYFFRRYALRGHEITGLIRMARTLAMEESQSSIEEDRGLMMLRLEDFMNRSRAAMDLKAELGAIKHMSLIQGLTQGDQQTPLGEMMKVIENVSRQRQVIGRDNDEAGAVSGIEKYLPENNP